jgi:hypothetical protein
MPQLTAPLILIAVGIGWLLHSQKIIPGVNWIWILLLGTVGACILMVGKMSRTSLITGPFLIAWAGITFAKQIDALPENIEGPALVIIFGVLLAATRLIKGPEDLSKAETSDTP